MPVKSHFFQYLFVLLIIAIPFDGYSQNSYAKHYTFEDGLASNTVYFVYQDKEGFIWLGTDQGLNRFNGVEFEKYTVDDGLTDLDLLNYYYDSKDRLWFHTYNGIPTYYSKGKFYGPHNTKLLEGVQLNNYISAMAEDSKGKLYISSSFGELISIDNEGSIIDLFGVENPGPTRITDLWLKEDSLLISAKGHRIINLLSSQQFNTQISEPKLNHHIESLSLDSAVLISSRNNIFFLDDTYELFQTVDFPKDYEIYFLGPYGDHSIFVGTNKGLYEFSLITKTYRLLSETESPVTHAIVDSQNGIWFSTLGAGVSHIPDTSIKAITNGELSTQVVSSVKNMNGKIWYGRPNLRYGRLADDGIEEYQLQVDPRISKDGRILDFFPIEKELYFKIEKVTYQLDGEAKLFADNNGIGVSSSAYDDYGDLWLSGIHGALPAKEHKDKKNNQDLLIDIGLPIQSISFSDSNEKAYLGTSDGVYQYSMDTKEVDSSFAETRSQKVVGLVNLNQNRLLVVTANNGLYLYEGERFVKHFSKTSDLIPQGIAKVQNKNEDEVWCVSDKTILKIQFAETLNDELQFDIFNTSNGLPETIIHDIAFKEDQIFLATDVGLLIFQEAYFNQEANSPAIAEIKLEGDTMTFYDDSLFQLDYGQSLAVKWKGISFETKNIVYQYRLNNGEWFDLPSAALSYSSLPIGEHLFQIRAKSDVSKWSSAKEIVVLVSGKWWNQPWVKWGLISLFVISIGLLFQFNLIEINKAKVYTFLQRLSRSIIGNEQLTIKTENGIEKINAAQINWIKSDGNYCHIVLRNRNLMVLSTLKSFEERLKESPKFMRVHRSYLVNLDEVEAAKSSSIKINELEIPIGDTYKKQYQLFFKSFQSTKA